MGSGLEQTIRRIVHRQGVVLLQALNFEPRVKNGLVVNTDLALYGGKPTIDGTLLPYDPITEEDVDNALTVLRSRRLSGFLGAPGKDFLGGERCRSLEEIVCRQFGGTYAVAVNSWTSGLVAAVGALQLEPGDEVITTPWTMCATATGILHWDLVPRFVDIDPVTYNLDPEQVVASISERTRAILAVDIFGLPSQWEKLRQIADDHGLYFIVDSAQAPISENKRNTDTRPDIWGYSFNYHKHVHCGEGGVAVTDDDLLADRMQRIRNHGETVPVAFSELPNNLGYNFRLGEIESALLSGQLSRVDDLVNGRRKAAQQICQGLEGMEGLQLPPEEVQQESAFYILPLRLDSESVPASRDSVVAALKAEGVPGLSVGYQNVHRLPNFAQRIGRGSRGLPWTLGESSPPTLVDSCPVAERLHDQTFLGIHMCGAEFGVDATDKVIEAFRKVWNHMDRLER